MSRPVGPPVAGFSPPPAPGPEAIDGRTVRLERLDPARHAASLFAANRGADWVWDYLGYGPFPDLSACRDWQARMAAGADPFFYAFVPREAGHALGLGALMRIDRPNGVIEVGHIQMAPAMQRTTAACDALNAPSRAAALRFGFTFEGVFRQHMIVKGRNRDTAWFAITDADWPQVRARWQAWLSPANFDAAGRQRRSLAEMG